MHKDTVTKTENKSSFEVASNQKEILYEIGDISEIRPQENMLNDTEESLSKIVGIDRKNNIKSKRKPFDKINFK